MVILCSPGMAFLPIVGVVLALVTVCAGIAQLFSFAVWMSGACPFCEALQTVSVPMEELSWRRVQRRSTNRVFGVDCVVCKNRMIVRVDDRVAIPAPRVVTATR